MNNTFPPFTPDDPRLTAYAHGELHDPAEKAALEAALARDPALRAALGDIRALDSLLSEGFAQDLEAAPTNIARFRLPPADPAQKAHTAYRHKLILIASALAASVALAIALYTSPNPRQSADTLATAQDEVELFDIPTVSTTTIESDPSLTAALEIEIIDSVEAEARRQTAKTAKKETLTDVLEEDVIVLPKWEIPAVDTLYSNPHVAAAASIVASAKDYPLNINIINAQLEGDGQGFTDAFKYNDSSATTHNTATYDTIVDNPFRSVKDEALSTFSIDVDTAAYSQVRSYLLEYESLPPKGAVRIEEFINYFDYDYAPPATNREPFAVHLAAMDAPWAKGHKLVRIALKGYEIPWEERPAANLVFLVDVSGSMDEPNKLPLVQESLALLVNRLDRRDRVAIVTYAGEASLALPSTTADNRETILHAIANLSAGGSTQGSAGITLAYEIAQKHTLSDGANRVILCTDGDFNIGITNRSDLVSLIEGKAKSGIFLSIIGFGMGNYKDATLEELSNKGNGTYAYIDSPAEARRVFLRHTTGMLHTIAKDVKIQVEFNPAHVASYRLIGYENRHLNKEDFNDDTKDAGEIGAGHTVTALYEIIPAGKADTTPAVDPLKYQTAPELADSAKESGEYLTVKLRYKEPDGHESKLIEEILTAEAVRTGTPDRDFRFAASVAAFGMLLRESPHAGDATFQKVHQWAQDSLPTTPDDSRTEFLHLIQTVQSLPHHEG